MPETGDMLRKSIYACNQNNITVRMWVVMATGTWDGDWSMLTGYIHFQLLSCCIREAATNQGVPETAQKNCDVYTSMLILLVTPDKKRTCMKAAWQTTLTAPKWFPDACIDNQATNLPVTHFQGIGCGRFLWSSRSTTTATCLTNIKWWQPETVPVPLHADAYLNTSTLETCF